jgi:NAD-dependent deacetylase
MKFDPILVEKLKNARHIVVFTGASISQESGIPTFRDTLTGFWENLNPNDLATAKAFEKNPDVVWGWYESRRLMVLNCQPNSAHYAIAKMQEKTKVTVITQNVDGLHERAGSRDVNIL